MSKPFYEEPILNSPYLVPTRHHALGENGQPLDLPPEAGRRRCSYVVPVPKARKQRRRVGAGQTRLALGETAASDGPDYSVARIVDEIRQHLAAWRAIPNPNDWGVTPSTARLLEHWRTSGIEGVRPFFCQIEAVETIIWLSEVARGRRQYSHIFGCQVMTLSDDALHPRAGGADEFRRQASHRPTICSGSSSRSRGAE